MDLVFLFGPAAAGKLTVARAVAEKTGLPVFHNHLIVDAVGAVFPFGSEPFVRLRHRFWLDTFREAARQDRSLIFTFAPEPTVPRTFLSDVRETLGGSGRLRLVRLDCPIEEQERRIENPDRSAFRKLNSLDTLRQIRASQSGDGFEMPEPELAIDTSRTPVEESARRILESLQLVPAANPHRMYD